MFSRRGSGLTLTRLVRRAAIRVCRCGWQHVQRPVSLSASQCKENSSSSHHSGNLDNIAWSARENVFGLAIPYPSFEPSLTATKFIDGFQNLEAGERKPDTEVLLAGRITAKREASKKLYFYDIDCGGHRIQIMSPLQQYEPHQNNDSSSDTSSQKTEFKTMHSTLRRGDIIGIRGFPGKTKVGELSLIPKEISLLSPCLLPLPEELKDVDARFRQRHVDLLVNSESKSHLVTRSRVIQHIRRFFEDRDFLEVETPILSTKSSGAMARPFTTESTALVHQSVTWFSFCSWLWITNVLVLVRELSSRCE